MFESHKSGGCGCDEGWYGSVEGVGGEVTDGSRGIGVGGVLVTAVGAGGRGGVARRCSLQVERMSEIRSCHVLWHSSGLGALC